MLVLTVPSCQHIKRGHYSVKAATTLLHAYNNKKNLHKTKRADLPTGLWHDGDYWRLKCSVLTNVNID